MHHPVSASLRPSDIDKTYVGELDGRLRVLLIEPDPILGLDVADALEAAGLRTIGPVREPAQALSLLPYLTLRGVVLGQERRDGADRATLRHRRSRGIPVVVHAARPETPELSSELSSEFAAEPDGVPVPSRPAWAEDVVGAVAAPLPARGGR